MLSRITAALRVPHTSDDLTALGRVLTRSLRTGPSLVTILAETAPPPPREPIQEAIQHLDRASRAVVVTTVRWFQGGVWQVPRRRPATYRRRRILPRPRLGAVLTNATDPGPASILQGYLQDLDAWYQIRIEQFFAQIIQPHQRQHRDALGETFTLDSLSPTVKHWNRRIAYAGAAWAMALSGIGILQFASLGFNLYFSGVFIQLGLGDMWRKRRPTELGKGALVSLLLLASNMLGVASAAAFLGVILYKITLMAQQQTEQQLRDVFGQLPTTVALLHDGQVIIVPREQLKLGDIVIVVAGESIPVDGAIVSGTATIDQHALTGEAQPVERGAGESVFAATLVLMGEIHVRTDQLPSATVVAQITNILTATQSSHLAVISRGERIADASVTPALLAGLIALPLHGLSSMLAVWMIPVGGIMRTTGPMTMLSYLDMTARSAILVKDGRSLELLHTIDTVVFDKTGTLTQEQPTVDTIYTVGTNHEDRILALAAAVEAQQSHPIAAAICAAAAARGLTVPTATQTQVHVGYGIGVEIAGAPVLLGSQRYMAACAIPIPDDLVAVVRERATQGKSTIYLAVAGAIQGAIGLTAAVRPEVPLLIRQLHARGLRLVLITGDQSAPAQALAIQLGIDQVFAEVLPAQKADLVTHLQAQGRRVLFVGDGINDSIALKQATVSVSLLGATTVATDTAQIVLMDRSLCQLDNLFELARRFDRDMQIQMALAVIPEVCYIGGVFAFGWGIAGGYAAGYLVMLSATAYAFHTMWRQERLEPLRLPVQPTYDSTTNPAYREH